MAFLPSLIIIGGACGSGKTTVGKGVAERMGYTFVDGDDFHAEANKAKMAMGNALTDEDRRPWLEKLASMWASENGDGGGKYVVACSALKQKYRSALLGEKARDRSGIILMLQVPKEVLLKRTQNRKGHYAKSNLIESQLETLQVPEGGEEPYLVMVDGTRTVEEVVEEIIHKISF